MVEGEARKAVGGRWCDFLGKAQIPLAITEAALLGRLEGPPGWLESLLAEFFSGECDAWQMDPLGLH
jgi:hypothetical protein